MILSDEPGLDPDGAYGIRMENLLLVKEAEFPGARKKFLALRDADPGTVRPRLDRPDAANTRRAGLAECLSSACMQGTLAASGRNKPRSRTGSGGQPHRYNH